MARLRPAQPVAAKNNTNDLQGVAVSRLLRFSSGSCSASEVLPYPLDPLIRPPVPVKGRHQPRGSQ